MFNSERITIELKKRNWSDYKLANEADIAGSTLSNLLNKKILNPKLNTLLKIAEALKMPVDYFFERDKKSPLFGIENEIIKDFPINDKNYIKVFDGEKINNMIKRRNMSGYKLAKKIQVAQSSLCEMLNNHNTNPHVNTLFKISEILNVPINSFLKNKIVEGSTGKNIELEYVPSEKNEHITHVEVIERALHKMNKSEQEKAYSILKIVFEKYF